MIITLCGSARFEAWYHAWNEALSLSGHQVFGLASYPSQHDGVQEWYTPEEKRGSRSSPQGKDRGLPRYSSPQCVWVHREKHTE